MVDGVYTLISPRRGAIAMTTVMLDPITTSVMLTAVKTRVELELVDIYSLYYWLFPGHVIVEHQEAGQ